MSLISYHDLVSVACTEEEAKPIAAEIEVVNGPNDDAGSPTPTLVHDLNVPYEPTEEYKTPTAEMLFPPTPLQTPMQIPLPETVLTPLPESVLEQTKAWLGGNVSSRLWLRNIRKPAYAERSKIRTPPTRLVNETKLLPPPSMSLMPRTDRYILHSLMPRTDRNLGTQLHLTVWMRSDLNVVMLRSGLYLARKLFSSLLATVNHCVVLFQGSNSILINLYKYIKVQKAAVINYHIFVVQVTLKIKTCQLVLSVMTGLNITPRDITLLSQKVCFLAMVCQPAEVLGHVKIPRHMRPFGY